ncbi:MAG: HD domain-containing protein [Novosphingobium sp.]
MRAFGKTLAALALLGAGCSLAHADTPVPSWRGAVESFAAEHFKHPAWGYAHSRRDYALAKQLAREDGVALDDDVLFAAAMLHDIAAFPPLFDPKGDHADQAVAALPAKLKELGFPEAKVPAVLEAVRTHMFDRKPVSAEAIYLHDADGLDWLGAIGVYRLVAIVDAGGGQPDGATVVAMLRQRLEQVPAGIVSSSGRRLLPARASSLRAYLDELSGQTEALKTL